MRDLIADIPQAVWNELTQREQLLLFAVADYMNARFDLAELCSRLAAMRDLATGIEEAEMQRIKDLTVDV